MCRALRYLPGRVSFVYYPYSFRMAAVARNADESEGRTIWPASRTLGEGLHRRRSGTSKTIYDAADVGQRQEGANEG